MIRVLLNSEMAEDNADDILVRLDEIEKLQTELRHLVPRVTSNSSIHRDSGHQDPSRDSRGSIRFPSLFTFPLISNFTSAPKNVQKSAARLNLNSKSLSSDRCSTINLKNAGRSSQSGTRETNVFKSLLRGSDVNSSRGRNSLALTSAADSRASTRSGVASRVAKDPQEAIRKRLKGETSKTAARDKTQRVTGERSNMLSGNENVNSSEWSTF